MTKPSKCKNCGSTPHVCKKYEQETEYTVRCFRCLNENLFVFNSEEEAVASWNRGEDSSE